MNKKFLSVALLGTLMVSSGAFVGCADYDDDIANLQQQINQLSSSSQTTVQGVQDKIAALDSQASALEQAKNDLANQLNNAKADAAAAADKALKAAQDASADAKKAAEDLTAAIARVANLEAKVEGLEKAVKDLQAAKDELSANLTAVTDRLAKAEHQAADNAAAIAQAQADLKALDAKVAAVSSEIGARIDVIDEKLNNIEKNYVGKSDLQDKLNELNKQDAELKLQIEANANYLKEVKEALAKLQGADSEILAKIVKASEDIAANQKAIAELQEAITNLKAAATSYASKDELKNAIDAINNRLKSIEEYSGSVQIALNAADIRDLQRDLKALAEKEEADVKELKGMIADAIAKAEKELAEAVSTLNKTIEDTKKDLEGQIADVDAKAEENAANIATLTFDLRALEMNVSVMRSELEAKMEAADDSLYALITEEYKDIIEELRRSTLDYIQNDVYAVLAEEDARIEGKLDEYIAANNLAIAGIQNKIASLEAALAAINGQLKAIVFQPEFYMDGIEAAEYTYLKYVALSSTGDTYGVDDVMINNLGDYVKIKKDFVWRYYHSGAIDVPVTACGDEEVNSNDQFVWNKTSFTDEHMKPYTVVGVEDSVVYALNPSNAVLTAQQLDLVAKNYNAMTRSGVAGVKVVRCAQHKPGYLTVVYTVDSKKICEIITANNDENYSVINGKPNTTIIELEANLGDTVINSDLAAIYETAIQPVAIAANALAKDWKVPAYCGLANSRELYKNPYRALNAVPTVNIEYNNTTGINLADYVEIHMLKRDDERVDRDMAPEKAAKHEVVTLAQANSRYGLTYEFKLVPYEVEAYGNVTNPSQYVHLNGATTTATVVPGTVNADGSHNEAVGESSIGKQPLVQVLVYNGKDVVLDAYIKLQIVREIADKETPVFNLGTKDYDCEGVIFNQTWSQVSDYLLQQTVKMSHTQFQSLYTLDYYAEGGVAQYTKDAKGNYSLVPHVNAYAYIKYLDWENSATENSCLGVFLDTYAQQYVYEQKDHTVTLYVRYQDPVNPDVNAKVYVPLKITMNPYKGGKYGNKNINYWYKNDGGIETLSNEALRLNVNYPKDNGNTRLFERDIDNAWDGMKINFTVPAGVPAYVQNEEPIYYFHPLTNKVTVTDEYDGTVYELHVDYSDVVCDIWNTGAAPTFQHGYGNGKLTHKLSVANKTAKEFYDIELNHKVLTGASETVYRNTVLKARVKGTSTWIRIAVLDPKTGLITYLHDAVTNAPITVYDVETEMAKKVLNAVAHDKAQAQAIIGVYRTDNCGHAVALEENTFPAYFLRPLDIVPAKDRAVLDAKANGDSFYLFEALNFEDWRDVKFVNGTDYKNVWLMAYYNVNSVKVDLDKMTTNMNKHDINKDLLKPINVEAWNSFKWLGGSTSLDLSAYNAESKGTKATYEAIRDMLGKIFYENHGENASDFDVRIPLEFGYDWGTLHTSLTIHVKGTMANGEGGSEN